MTLQETEVWTDRRTNGQTGGQTNVQTDGPTDIRTDGPTGIRTDKQTSSPNHSSCFKFHLFAYYDVSCFAWFFIERFGGWGVKTYQKHNQCNFITVLGLFSRTHIPKFLTIVRCLLVFFYINNSNFKKKQNENLRRSLTNQNEPLLWEQPTLIHIVQCGKEGQKVGKL